MRLIPLSMVAVLTCSVLATPLFAGDDVADSAKTHSGKGKMAKRLAKFDVNHDGVLDESEKAAARAAFAARLKEKHPELLAKIDTDADGIISEAEMKAGRAKLKEFCANKKKHTKDN